MSIRKQTKQIHIKDIVIGGQDKILIQSMCNIKTERADEVIAQINECAALGADLMRVSVMDEKDAHAIKQIKEGINIPLVADIHFDYRLALIAMDMDVDKIRINPGNIGSVEGIKLVVAKAKEKGVPIRIGVNSGSLDKEIHDYKEEYTAAKLVESAKKHVKILEDLGFYDIVISLKGSNVKETIAAYRLASKTFPYPLHLGITEAGFKDIALIRSAAGLAPLLLEGIGDTMRVSITGELEEEIKVAKAILQDAGVQKSGINIISCPTCGRLQSDLVSAIKIVEERTKHIKAPLNISVMGCVVNALGEAKGADVAIAFGKGNGLVIRHGEIVAKLKESELVERFLQEVEDEVKNYEK